MTTERTADHTAEPPSPENSGSPAPLVRRIELPDMIAYAGATWDWHRIHYDQGYLDAKKIPAPIVDGQVFGALLAEQAQDWAGDGWRLAAMDFRFANLVFAGESVRCELIVTDRTEEKIVLTGRVVVLGDERAAVSKATVELCRR